MMSVEELIESLLPYIEAKEVYVVDTVIDWAMEEESTELEVPHIIHSNGIVYLASKFHSKHIQRRIERLKEEEEELQEYLRLRDIYD